MLPRPLAKVVAGQHGVVSRTQSLSCGMTGYEVDTKARRGEWRRLYRGTYLVDAELYDGVPFLALAAAALLTCGPCAVLVCDTAIRAWHLEGLPRTASAIHVAMPVRCRRPQRPIPAGDFPPVRQHWLDIAPSDVAAASRLRVTSLVLSLAQTVAVVDRASGLSILDSALHRSALNSSQLAVIRSRAAGKPGVARVRELTALADERAASPFESHARLICIDGDVPPDELQMPVRDQHGILLGYGDLGWRRRRGTVVGECDGRGPHSTPTALFRDRYRHNDFTLAGVAHHLRWTWTDMQRGYLLATARQAVFDVS